MDASQRMESILKLQPSLIRDPTVKSGYANPLRKSHLEKALHFLLDKQGIRSRFNPLWPFMTASSWSPRTPNCTASQFMSLIGPVTATEKQVPWHVPANPISQVTSQFTSIYANGSKRKWQVFTNTSYVGCGVHSGGFTATGLVHSRKQIQYHFLELKAVLLALQCFEHFCKNQTVLIPMENTTVVAYINKERGMKSGSLCALFQ